MTAWDIGCIVVASWTITAVLVAPWIGRAMRDEDAAAAAEHVNWLPFLPPVPAPVTPPFTQAIPSADWFAGMPCDVLSDAAVHSLFDSIVDGEFS